MHTNVWLGNLKETDHFENLIVDGKSNFKSDLLLGRGSATGLIWRRCCPLTGSYGNDDEPSVSIKKGLFDYLRYCQLLNNNSTP